MANNNRHAGTSDMSGVNNASHIDSHNASHNASHNDSHSDFCSSSPSEETLDLYKKLEAYVVPGTEPIVLERYVSLVEHAAALDFGALENNIIVLDTETTGLSKKECALTQISAMRLEKGKRPDESQWFTTFVNPHQPIPPEIEALTHIYAHDVVDAPDAQEAVHRLSAFVAGNPILAHNASFDKGFVEAAKEGSPVSTRWIDTLALSRIALPSLRSHKLSDMAQLFSCDSVTHRANDDVCALAGVWHIILCALFDMPEEILETLCCMHEDVEWQYRFIFESLFKKKTGSEPKKLHYLIPVLKDIRHELFTMNADEASGAARDHATSDACHKEDRDKLASSATPGVNWARALKHLDHEFSDSGTLAALCGASAFEPRPEQLEMAQAVATAQANRGISLIEAGTGIGKSFAYLIPSILFAKKTGHAVGVATRTNVLAHQLITSDLPRLAKEYKHGFSYLIAKGYNHYPSLEKIEALIRGNFDLKTIKTIRFSRSKVESEILTTIALVVSASCECSCVDVDNLGIRWNMLSRSWFVSTSRNESREHGAANQHFFIDELRQRARHTDILITNHALLLSDIACGHNIFPEINDWVVDEAHGFAEQAAATWTEETSAYAVAQALKQLGTHEHGLISDVVSHCASTNAAATLEKLAPQIEKASSSVLSGVEEAMQTLAALDLSKCPYAGNLGFGEKTISVRVYAELRESDAWLAFDQAIQDIQERLTELIKLLQQVLAALAFQKQFSKTLNLRACLLYTSPSPRD